MSVRPAEGFIGQMVTRFRVRDVTGDPDREVEGRVTVVVRGKPATPTAPRIGEVRDRTVVLSWDAPDNRGAPITGYRVVASPGNIVRQCASTTCTIDGLTNDVEYTFTVAAQNDVDWSEPERPVRAGPARRGPGRTGRADAGVRRRLGPGDLDGAGLDRLADHQLHARDLARAADRARLGLVRDDELHVHRPAERHGLLGPRARAQQGAGPERLVAVVRSRWSRRAPPTHRR